MSEDQTPGAPDGIALDPDGIPLTGLHLIEASAGTGKTYAIAHLVLRLILDAGCRIDEILVLTFTEAATEELRDRISRRLRQARALLAGGATDDSLLAQTLGRQTDPALALARLDDALASLDQAAIRTIHGFCQRVLRDFAFESGAPFDAELITDESDLRRGAAEDFWRRRMAEADAEEAAWLLAELPQGPASLLERLGGHLGRARPRLLPEGATGWFEGGARLLGYYRALADAWPGAREAVMGLLADNPSLSRTSYRPEGISEAIAQMDAYCTQGPAVSPPKRLALFTPEKLRQATKKGGTTPEHPFLDLCGRLAALDLEALQRARGAELLAAAYAFLRDALARRKYERRVIYFDDLLIQTAQALEGPRGEALAARVRTAYPRALIDEFQDTDDLQYRIFRRIYGAHLRCDQGDAGTGKGGIRKGGIGLFLIGDPKQAIYGFRGADIFTYIAARRQVRSEGQLHTLDTNRRSTGALVQAVNRLFGRPRAPFIFEPDIRFEPVEPWGEAQGEPLLIEGEPAAPLVFRWLPLTEVNATKRGDRITADAARAVAVADCARQIGTLLRGAALGATRIGDRPLRAGDIAVLVRSHQDGRLVREALGGLGIGCVSIGRESVFDSEEAEDLAALLRALGPGAGDGDLRRALATRLLGWTAADLAVPAAGAGCADARWDQLLARFDDSRETWRSRGFMAALDALIQGEQVPERLRRGPDGERRLTNLLHLAELAQAASREHPGVEGLERWLADQRRPGGTGERGGDGALLRLESDEHLVQVVSFHKSKGLEYPVVFLPLPWSQGRGSPKTAPVAFHDRETLDACLDLGSPDLTGNQGLAEEEDLAERLRLFYVAVTRAKHRCLIHWGAVNQAESSAAAYLLHQGPAGEPARERVPGLNETDLRADLEALAAALPGSIAVDTLDLEGPAIPAPVGRPGSTLEAAVFGGSIPDDWRLLSFSALAQGRDGERPDHDALAATLTSAPEPDPDLGRVEAADVAPGPGAGPEARRLDRPAPVPAIDPVFRFPRGVRAGHCLHDLFEHLDFRAAAGPGLHGAVASALARHGIEPQWTETLVELVTRVLDAPLGPPGLRLRGVGPEDRRNELEFHFALDRFDPAGLTQLLAEHGVPGGVPVLASAGAAARALSGLMKGFVDLVLRAEGRFYVVDYKSNHLGDSLDDYGPEGMGRAMVQHGYHLQYLIYTLALHRYLKRRLPGYDYDRHQGGALYLFLRGMTPAGGPGQGIFAARPSRRLIEDLDRLFGASVTGGSSYEPS